MKINYKKIVDPNTFIGRFMAFMENQETAYAYDFWSAVWLISCALGREVVIDRPRAPVYMNMYLVLVAESGVTRKSSSVKMATDVVRELIDTTERRVHLVEDSVTPERLLSDLSQLSHEYGHATCVISISELVRFLGKEKYNMTMPGLLTDLYDAPEYRVGGGTLAAGRRELRKVWMNFLSASTPSWLCRAVNPDVVEGGFTSRCLFIVADQPKKCIAWPTEKTDDRATFLQGVVNELTQIGDRTADIGRISITPDGLATFTSWYKRRDRSLDPYKSSFESREDAHVLRLAGILSINDNRWIINRTDIKKAISLVDEAKERGSRIFFGANTDKVIIGVDKLRSALIAAGRDGVGQGDLYFECRYFLKKAEFQAALEIMHELGLVQQFVQQQQGAGRPRTIWRATQNITKRGAIEQVIQGMGQ